MALFKLHDNSLLVSLDIGSYSVRCSVFQKGEKIPLKLLAFTEKKSIGLEESQITNFESLNLVFSEVLKSAEELCGSSFSELYLGFSPPFHSFHSRGMVALFSREVRRADRNLAIQTACAVPLPDQHICLHNYPESFYVDAQPEVSNPIGLSGLRLETEVCIVSVPQFYCRDIIKSLKLLGYTPRSFFHNLVAFGQNLTDSFQKKNGVCICDIGYKSTRAIVYLNGKTKKMFSIPIGGYHFSQDLSSQLGLSLESAEILKETKGQILSGNSALEASLEVENTSLYVPQKAFVQTLEKTAKNFLEQIKRALVPDQLINKLSSGFIFTGGTAYLPGFLEMAGLYLGSKAGHPVQWYEKPISTNNLALIQQAYLEEELKDSRQNFIKKHFVWRELF